jgi:hypothetical protein
MEFFSEKKAKDYLKDNESCGSENIELSIIPK